MTERDAASPSQPSGLPVGDLLKMGPPSTDLSTPPSALAIGAHPDDIEFGCGATLAKWADTGCRVRHLILTDGSKGTWDEAADLHDLVAERRAESLAAAAVIDSRPGGTDSSTDRVVFLDRVDGELANGLGERREVTRIIRTLRPSVVFGHDPWRRYRLHPDHRAAGFLTLDAVVSARDPHFFPDLGLPPHRPDAVLLFEADLPNHVENASGYDKRKIEALLRHRSQWLSTMGLTVSPTTRDGSGEAAGLVDFAEKVRRQLGEHGALAGLALGEAFHHLDEI